MCITSSIFGDENSCLFWESVFWILLDASYQLIVLVESCTCTHPPPRSRSTELMRRNKVCSRSSSTVGTFGSVALTFQDWTCIWRKSQMMFRDQDIDMSCQGQNKGTLSVIQPRERAAGQGLVSDYFISLSRMKSNPSAKCQKHCTLGIDDNCCSWWGKWLL